VIIVRPILGRSHDPTVANLGYRATEGRAGRLSDRQFRDDKIPRAENADDFNLPRLGVMPIDKDEVLPATDAFSRMGPIGDEIGVKELSGPVPLPAFEAIPEITHNSSACIFRHDPTSPRRLRVDSMD